MALAGLVAPAFAGALIVAGTHPGPTGQVASGREAPQVGSQLNQQHVSRPWAHSRNGLQALLLRGDWA
jgi:hypothetical protein